MTKSQIFTEAHKIAKKLTGNYSARMSFAIKMAYQKAKIVKRALELACSTSTNSYKYVNNYCIEMRLASFISGVRNRHNAVTSILGIDTFKHLIKNAI